MNSIMTEEERAELREERKKRFRILVCIDGSDEGYHCLRYAAKIGGSMDSDIILLYVR
ncbi:MAG TPA: universal stress protein, partial [Rhodospirillales bacterium]|nr:universal stress protein [Rhodospirillales bacterium]